MAFTLVLIRPVDHCNRDDCFEALGGITATGRQGNLAAAKTDRSPRVDQMAAVDADREMAVPIFKADVDFPPFNPYFVWVAVEGDLSLKTAPKKITYLLQLPDCAKSSLATSAFPCSSVTCSRSAPPAKTPILMNCRTK